MKTLWAPLSYGTYGLGIALLWIGNRLTDLRRMIIDSPREVFEIPLWPFVAVALYVEAVPFLAVGRVLIWLSGRQP